MIKMARCIRKLENDRYWIIYCNTSDVLFDYLFVSLKVAKLFLDYYNETHILPAVVNPVDEEDVKQLMTENIIERL